MCVTWLWYAEPGDPFDPLPSGSHADPFQRAMLSTSVVPACWNTPPTTTSPLGITAELATKSPALTIPTPGPSADQTPLCNLATCSAGMPTPTDVNSPPTIMPPSGGAQTVCTHGLSELLTAAPCATTPHCAEAARAHQL